MRSLDGLSIGTYEWAKELATNLNRWASNKEKRAYFARSYNAFTGRDKDLFVAGFNDAIEYDYEFTDEGY